MTGRRNFGKIYGAACWLGVLSLFGLLTALVRDDIWDVVACAALSIPILVIAWKWAINDKR